MDLGIQAKTPPQLRADLAADVNISYVTVGAAQMRVFSSW